MDFETVLLLAMGALALVAAGLLLSSWLDRRRRRASSVFNRLPTAPAPARQKLPAPTVLSVTVAERPRVSANPVREWDRQTNYGMF